MQFLLHRVLMIAVSLVFYGTNALAVNNMSVIPMSVDDLTPLKNVISVASVNADFTSPVAAINSITDASAANPYLIVMAAGIYTLTEALLMKEYVDIVGSGVTVTKLTGAISTDSVNASSALVVGADNSQLRDLSLENTGGGDYAFAVFNSFVSPSLSNLTINTSGSLHNYGVYNVSASPSMSNLTISANGGLVSYGVRNASTSLPNMRYLTITVSGGSTTTEPPNIGVANISSSSPSMNNLIINASGVESNPFNFGVYNSLSSPNMTNLTVNTVAGTGVFNQNSSPIIRSSYLMGTAYSVYNSTPSSQPNISRSTLVGDVDISSSICTFVDDGVGNTLDSACQ